MKKSFQVIPVGFVRKEGNTAFLEIGAGFEAGLLGLDGFSHLILICWFHESDTRRRRATLRVHPKRDRANPLTGVFATRSPRRPNPVAIFVTPIHSIQGNRIEIDAIDAFEGTPIIDIKPYIPSSDSFRKAAVPSWVKGKGGKKERKRHRT